MPVKGLTDAQKAQIAAFLAGGKAAYIGVPAGSDTETLLKTLTTQNQANYQAGQAAGYGALSVFLPPGAPTKPFMAYKTGSEVDLLSRFSPDDIWALQQQLNQAGLLDTFVPYQPDPKTRAAFAQILGMANIQQTDWETALNNAAALPLNKKTSTAMNPPLTVTQTDPDVIRNVARGVTSAVAGGGISSDEIERFVQSYQQLETDRQTQNYNQTYGPPGGPASQQGPGGTSLDPHPNVAAMLEQQLRREHPGQVNATYLGSLRDNILAVLTRGQTAGQTAGGGA